MLRHKDGSATGQRTGQRPGPRLLLSDSARHRPLARLPYAALYPKELRGLVVQRANIPGITLLPSLTPWPDNGRYWHFLFNPIADLPKALLSVRERWLIERLISRKTATPSATFGQGNIDEYKWAYRTLGCVRGMLGYYRAVVEDMEPEREFAGLRLMTQVLALGADVGSAPDIHVSMQAFAADERGSVIAECFPTFPRNSPPRWHKRCLRSSRESFWS